MNDKESKQVNNFAKLRVFECGKIEYFRDGVWHTKAQRPTTNGYLKFGHKEIVNGKSKSFTFLSHRIVAEAFIPKIDGKTYVNHINGKKKDNRAINLEWCTAKENTRHAKDNGLAQSWVGEKNIKAKIKWQDVIAIRALYGAGFMNVNSLQQKYGLNKSSIYGIVKRTKWTNV